MWNYKRVTEEKYFFLKEAEGLMALYVFKCNFIISAEALIGSGLWC